jgi:D-glycero-alpha-D-manno-heptose 1-phosphate guanylyltransferase
MTREAIVLAGGLGTRLRKVTGDLPKPMADINGRPFLSYLMDYLAKQHIDTVILSVGYRNEAIQDYFGDSYNKVQVLYSVETEPLGTGGAIKMALASSVGSDVIIMNGDSFFGIELRRLYEFHVCRKSMLTVAVKRMKPHQRYGSLFLDSRLRIGGFHEKSSAGGTLINGGVYILDKSRFCSLGLPSRFSFEKDFIEKYYKDCDFYGLEFGDYFVDIGIPEDYEKARREAGQMAP